MKDPREIASMAELRAEIDAHDAKIVAMLAERARLIDRAAELKPAEKMPARITARVNAVLDNVRAEAEARGLDPALVEGIWRGLIEWSIAREEKVLGKGEAE